VGVREERQPVKGVNPDEIAFFSLFIGLRSAGQRYTFSAGSAKTGLHLAALSAMPLTPVEQPPKRVKPFASALLLLEYIAVSVLRFR
jgi:hypothetical protein